MVCVCEVQGVCVCVGGGGGGEFGDREGGNIVMSKGIIEIYSFFYLNILHPIEETLSTEWGSG